LVVCNDSYCDELACLIPRRRIVELKKKTEAGEMLVKMKNCCDLVAVCGEVFNHGTW